MHFKEPILETFLWKEVALQKGKILCPTKVVKRVLYLTLHILGIQYFRHKIYNYVGENLQPRLFILYRGH